MKKEEITKKTIFSVKLAKKVFLSLIIVFIFEFFLFPAPVLAALPDDLSNISDSVILETNNN